MDKQLFESPLGSTAFKRIEAGCSHSVFYVPGHRNTLDEHKGKLIEDICAKNHINMLHWAYFGWDDSVSPHIPDQGEGYLRHWFDQTLAVFDHLSSGPQIVVGYSMGSYLALALAQARPDKISALVGLASGFGMELCDQAQALYGSFNVCTTNNQHELTLSKDMSGAVPIQSNLAIHCPVYLYHAQDDTLVNHKNCAAISKQLPGGRAHVTCVETGGHDLNRLEDREWLEKTLQKLVSGAHQ